VTTLLVVQEGLGRVVLIEGENRVEIPVGDKPHEIETTPDARTAFVSNFGLLEANYKVGTPGTTISVIDIGNRVERGRYHLPDGYTAPHGLKLRPPRCAELFTNTEEGIEAMVVFDAARGNVLRTFRLPPGVHNFLFSPDGTSLFAFTLRGEVLRMDPDTGRVEAHATLGSTRGLAWSADGEQLIASGKGELVLLDPQSCAIIRRISGLGVGQIFYPAATPDGRWIFAPAVLDGVVLVIDAVKGESVRRIETGSPLLFVMDAHGKQAWISNVLVPAAMLRPGAMERDGGVVRVHLESFSVTPVAGTSDANGLAVISRS
jgi:DNA-binding beta-propeller fold protein YncE